MNDKELIPVAIGLVLAIGGFALSFYTTSNNAAFWWDEAEYGILSKGLSSHSGFFGFYGDRSYRPPLIPIYIAILRSLFGEAVWNILTPLFTGLSLAALFLIGRRLFDMKAGLIAAGRYGLSHPFS